MDPIVFELLGSILVGGMVWLTVLRRPKVAGTETMPVLTIRKTRQVSSNHHRRSSSSIKGKNRVSASGFTRSRRKPRTKAVEQTSHSISVTQPEASLTTLETCPSCGLQAPDKLLAEHFLGSPSHRNGPEKPVATPTQTETDNEPKEDESKQSVRSLLQILVPPRAFGHRHAHRSISPISSVVQELGPGPRPHR